MDPGRKNVYIRPMLLFPLLACTAAKPVPEDLDGLAHWFWQNYEAGTDEELAEATVALHAAVGGESLEGAETGGLTDLGADEVALVELVTDPDPAAARGLVLINLIPCTLEVLEPILYALEQDALYEGVYDRYERVYTSDLDAYVVREAPHLGWQSDITATIMGATYTERVLGGLRWSPAVDGVSGAWGPVLLGRAWLPEPATFESGGKSFDQDYQLEVYWERAPGEVVHFYAVWRQGDYGAGLTTDSDAVAGILLDGLEDWDQDTATLCAGAGG